MEAGWHYTVDGRQAGPVSAAALRELVASGAVPPTALVWTAGMAGWAPAGSVAELAPAPAVTREDLDRASPGAVVGLSVITLGIYGIIKFYQAAKSYQRLARNPASNFEALFWSYLACGVVGALTLEIGVGFLLVVAEVVLGVFTLGEVLRLRARAVAEQQLVPAAPLTSDGTHKTLWTLGAVLAWIVVGIIPMIIQVVKFFSDHELVVGALERRLAVAAPVPPPLATAPPAPPAPAPQTVSQPQPAAPAFCTACGAGLPGAARFCNRCGAAVGA